MRLDFWNNPIVVSAFRVKYRRGGISQVTTLYMVLLVAVGAVLNYYALNFYPHPWQQIYFIAILGVQCCLSAAIAALATATSIKSEVVNRTLDFQRIAALSPREILLGKLLGEPAHAYLLAIATIPFAVWCWALGVPGLTFLELVLLYVNLFTTTLLFGSIGLLNRLEITEGKPAGGAGGGPVWGWIMLSIWLSFGSAFSGMSTSWYHSAAGPLTPILAIFGTAMGDPWMFGLQCYGIKVSYLWLTPIIQLFIAVLCFQAMVRRLLNPLNPPLRKAIAYLVLILFDVLAAGVLFDRLEPNPGRSAAIFCTLHLTASLILKTAVTPWRETLWSWVWRFRGRRPRLLDSWLGSRAESSMALVSFAVIGIAGLVLFLLVPIGLTTGWAAVKNDQDIVIGAALLTALLILTYGAIWQWCSFIMGRTGSGVYVFVIVVASLLPHMVGRYYQEDWLLAVAPTAHYMQWISPDSPLLNGSQKLALAPVLAVYALLLAATWYDLFRRMHRMERSVDNKLREMGVQNHLALSTTLRSG